MGEENLQLEGTSLDSMMECLTFLHWQAYGQPSGEQIAFWKLLEQDGGRGGGPSHVLRVLPRLSGSASALQGVLRSWKPVMKLGSFRGLLRRPLQLSSDWDASLLDLHLQTLLPGG